MLKVPRTPAGPGIEDTGQADVSRLQLAQLRDARATHDSWLANGSAHYDEVLLEVAERAENNHSLSKADIGGLLFWQRLRADAVWARRLHEQSNMEVRAVTGKAFSLARDTALTVSEAAGQARGALMPLHGFRSGDALPSAVLLALAPDRMAVYDRRAHAGLRLLAMTLADRPGRYREYMRLVEQLRLAEDPLRLRPWSARDVDLALYVLGGR